MFIKQNKFFIRTVVNFASTDVNCAVPSEGAYWASFDNRITVKYSADHNAAWFMAYFTSYLTLQLRCINGSWYFCNAFSLGITRICWTCLLRQTCVVPLPHTDFHQIWSGVAQSQPFLKKKIFYMGRVWHSDWQRRVTGPNKYHTFSWSNVKSRFKILHRVTVKALCVMSAWVSSVCYGFLSQTCGLIGDSTFPVGSKCEPEWSFVSVSALWWTQDLFRVHSASTHYQLWPSKG